MDGYTYTNIFETKGIEYLVIISFFMIFIPFAIYLNRQVKPGVKVKKVLGSIAAGTLQLPQGIFFSRYHTWAHLEKNGEAKTGLNDLILHLTGEVEVELYKLPGEIIGKGEPMARLRYNGNSLELASPITGEVRSINESLAGNPSVVRDDPYNSGWMYSLMPSNWKTDIDSCYLAEDANEWAKNELVRFKDFLAVSVAKATTGSSAVVLQDGGELVERALAHFPQEVWQEFQKRFLTEE